MKQRNTWVLSLLVGILVCCSWGQNEKPRSRFIRQVTSGMAKPVEGMLVDSASIDSQGVDEQPTPSVKVQPPYPEIALRAGVQGTVLLRIHINDSGRVTNAGILRSDAEIFNDPALTAARTWRFTPARRSGTPVGVSRLLSFRFALEPLDKQIPLYDLSDSKLTTPWSKDRRAPDSRCIPIVEEHFSIDSISTPEVKAACVDVANDTSLEEPLVLERQPLVLTIDSVAYNPKFVRRGEEGEVCARILIDTDGKVSAAIVTRSSNYKLDNGVLKSASKWKFVPAVYRGQHISVWRMLRYRFWLREP
ncbi:MAG: energy transducer TonB [Bacteroidota bacterium]|jgi:protein TonB